MIKKTIKRILSALLITIVLLALILTAGITHSKYMIKTPEFTGADGKKIPDSIAVFERIKLGGYG